MASDEGAEGPPAGPVDRRRTPRVAVPPGTTIRFDVRHRVKLLDISLSGALVAADGRVPVGARAQFRTALASSPFATEVVVKRCQEPSVPGTETRVGTAFVTMDEPSRRSLEQFLRKASE